MTRACESMIYEHANLFDLQLIIIGVCRLQYDIYVGYNMIFFLVAFTPIAISTGRNMKLCMTGGDTQTQKFGFSDNGFARLDSMLTSEVKTQKI